MSATLNPDSTEDVNSTFIKSDLQLDEHIEEVSNETIKIPTSLSINQRRSLQCPRPFSPSVLISAFESLQIESPNGNETFQADSTFECDSLKETNTNDAKDLLEETQELEKTAEIGRLHNPLTEVEEKTVEKSVSFDKAQANEDIEKLQNPLIEVEEKTVEESVSLDKEQEANEETEKLQNPLIEVEEKTVEESVSFDKTEANEEIKKLQNRLIEVEEKTVKESVSFDKAEANEETRKLQSGLIEVEEKTVEESVLFDKAEAKFTKEEHEESTCQKDVDTPINDSLAENADDLGESDDKTIVISSESKETENLVITDGDRTLVISGEDLDNKDKIVENSLLNQTLTISPKKLETPSEPTKMEIDVIENFTETSVENKEDENVEVCKETKAATLNCEENISETNKFVDSSNLEVVEETISKALSPNNKIDSISGYETNNSAEKIESVEIGTSKPEHVEVETDKENLDPTTGDAAKPPLHKRRSSGVTMYSIENISKTPKQLRVVANEFLKDPEQPGYDKYLELKLEINQLQQTVASHVLEIKQKEQKILELFPNKVKVPPFVDQIDEDVDEKELTVNEKSEEIIKKLRDELDTRNKEYVQLRNCLSRADDIIEKLTQKLADTENALKR